MKIQGWGRYPVVEAQVDSPATISQCADLIAEPGALIPRGLARSYGDSSLAPRVLATRYLDHFIAFDKKTGLLQCRAGVTLDAILRYFVPRGWFLPVTPGTRFVTVGGAVASDVHGKNHHVDGTFTDHVDHVELLLGSGEQVIASPQLRPDLFRATCGGMGLTGVILSAGVRLKSITSSLITETTIKLPDLDSILAAFAENRAVTYSVAWIDCLARGRHLGRSLLMLGEHAEEGILEVGAVRSLPVPFDLPAGVLNQASIKGFNALYYGRRLHARSTRRVAFEKFFYPLDGLSDWNRLYGKAGFLQYQLVLPAGSGACGLRKVLERIAASGRGSFLAVLKAFGPANQNYLSFPCEGYTLALDFKIEPAVFNLLEHLDKIVLDHGGRLYLAKDARMSEAMFKSGYPRWQEFEQIRATYHAVGKFKSVQSRRLGLQ